MLLLAGPALVCIKPAFRLHCVLLGSGHAVTIKTSAESQLSAFLVSHIKVCNVGSVTQYRTYAIRVLT